MKQLTGILVLSLFAIAACQQQRNQLNLVNNGYETLWIAIHETVPEDYTIITRLKEIFTEASPVLYYATRSRAYFRNISILVPPTWSNRPEYLPVTNETFVESNVLIDHPHSVYGNSPWAKQTGRCGDESEYIHLTPEYLTDVQTSTTNWGPAGKTIVHEWGHFRWGLFDEYPLDSENGVYFYFTWGSIEPVRCAVSIRGDPVDKTTNGQCRYDPQLNSYDANCRFVPKINNPNKPIASLMYLQFLGAIQHFCDSPFLDDPAYSHNMEAPNKHNQKCSQASCWEVMREHRDFSNNNNPPRVLTPAQLTPSFKVVQEVKPYRRVLILDRSSSMQPYLGKLRQAASDYILNTIEDGSWLGMVFFCATASPASPMLEITGQSVRQHLVSLLPIRTCGSTSIASGILEGIEVLRNHSDPAGGLMVLMTDGHENTPPFIADVNITVINASVKVDTIAFSPAAQLNIGSLAASAGGMSFYASGGSASTALYDAFAATVTLRGRGDHVVSLDSQVISLTSANAVVTKMVSIDSSLGRTTSFFFDYSHFRIAVELESPSGIKYNSSSGAAIYSHSLTEQSVRFTFNSSIEAGNWTYSVTNQASTINNVVVSVKSRPPAGASSIIVKPRLSTYDLQFSKDTKVHVVVEVSQGGAPLVNADVTAEFETPSGAFMSFPLHDKGYGSDAYKNDGVYSGYWLASDMTGDGRYSLKVRALPRPGGQTALRYGAGFSMAGSFQQHTYSQTPTGSFQRTSSGGSAVVGGYSASNVTDVFPPSTIDDLSILRIDYDSYLATISWTAVGDDQDRGQATRYDIRWSENVTQLIFDFATCSPVPTTWYHTGSPHAPLPSGETETFTFRVPNRGEGVPFVFAIQVLDDEGNLSGVSHPISVALLKPKSNTGLIVGLSVTLIILAAGVVAGYVVYRRCSRNKQVLDVERRQKKEKFGTREEEEEGKGGRNKKD